jgi:hypothetical protein
VKAHKRADNAAVYPESTARMERKAVQEGDRWSERMPGAADTFSARARGAHLSLCTAQPPGTKINHSCVRPPPLDGLHVKCAQACP